MRIATLGWDAEKNTATVEIDGTEGDNVNEGFRMIRCALRDKPWLKVYGEETPESVLRFLSSAFHMMSYGVRFRGDIVSDSDEPRA